MREIRELIKNFHVPITDKSGFTHFVDLKTDNQQEVIEDWVYFDGYNDKDVAILCSKWEYNLCPIHKRFINLTNGEDTLYIEPSDIIRCSGLNVPVGSIVYKVKINNNKMTRVEKPTYNEQSLVKEIENLVISHTPSYQTAQLRMDIYNNEYYFNFYLIDFKDAPYEWHGGSIDYKVDKSKSFVANLLLIKESIETNGIELEW